MKRSVICLGIFLLWLVANTSVRAGPPALGDTPRPWLGQLCRGCSPAFVEVSKEAGIDYLQHERPNPPEDTTQFRESFWMSGGAAAADFDGDGDPDLYATRLGARDLLYRNNGDGTFTDVAAAVGIPEIEFSNGAGWGDIDADGDPDLYITSLGDTRFYLLRNDNGVFVDETFSRGASIFGTDEHHGFSVSFGDVNQDGYLDIHTTEWRPDVVNNTSALSNSRLLLNRGSAQPGIFDDITASAGVAIDGIVGDMDGTFSFTSRFVDMDRDGHEDLLIASDFSTSRLFWNNGDNTFTDGTVAAGVGTDQNGMGSAIGDFDGDGWFDWFISSIYDPADTCGSNPECAWGTTGSRLYRYVGGRQFADVTDSAGVRDGSWGWGSAFFDFDNDGDLDLVQATGQRFPNEPVSPEDKFEDDPLRFWINQGDGTFKERARSLGLTDLGSAKGLLVFDYDTDGDQDLFIVNNGGSPLLYRNDHKNSNAWLRFRCSSTRHCLGARFEIPATGQVASMHASSNFLGQDEAVVHFGLGPNTTAVDTLIVTWPSGVVETLTDVTVNRVIDISATTRFEGTAFADTIFGSADRDYIYGYDGDDLLIGGDDDDFIDGGAGQDVLQGGAGNDTLFGGDDDDLLLGGSGDDNLSGGSGMDALYGDDDDDTLDGDDGADTLDGGEGNDILNGGNGSDNLFGQGGNDIMDGGLQGDSMEGGDGDDEMDGGAGNDILSGGTGNDVIRGGDGDDQISGDEGNDVLVPGLGADNAFGGLGNDIIRIDSADIDGLITLVDGGLDVDTLELTLTPEDEFDPAIALELEQFANFTSVNAAPGTTDGPTFSFSTLGIEARNIEIFIVNGKLLVGDSPRVYVDPDRVGDGQGTLLSPFNSWLSVEFTPGVTYLQKNGSLYEGQIYINLQATPEQPVVLGAYETSTSGSDRPIVRGPIVVYDSSYITVSGLLVEDNEQSAIALQASDHITVQNCEIRGSDIGIWATEASGPGLRIRNNLIHNNTSHGVALTLSSGVAGDENIVDHNSIYANGFHGIEIQSNYNIIEFNEVALNGSLSGGTSGIHVFSDSPEEDAARDNIIRFNVAYGTQENFGTSEELGPDGNGIELDKWSSGNDVYGNISYNNGGTGFVAFRADTFRFFGNAIFDNMLSINHANWARPTEVFVGAYSLESEDQIFDFVFQDNVIVSNGTFAGSAQTNITSVLIDAPTIFNDRIIQNNRYFNTEGGHFYLYGWDPGLAWGGGVSGDDIQVWNELKVNGDPDMYGGVTYEKGTSANDSIAGDALINVVLAGAGDDDLASEGGDDVLVGEDGNDIMNGGAGSDRMVGGRGNDEYHVDDPGDVVLEFPDSGNDTVYSVVTYNLPLNAENLILTGVAAIDGLGNESNNVMVGNEAANSLDGRGGSDLLQGFGGPDFLQGGPGIDFLDGGDDQDILYGGPGQDVLTGGKGDDVFIFSKGEGGGIILDFEGNQALLGDYLILVGYGPGATISYTGSDGLFRIDYEEDGVAASETISLVGIVYLHPVDYSFQ